MTTAVSATSAPAPTPSESPLPPPEGGAPASETKKRPRSARSDALRALDIADVEAAWKLDEKAEIAFLTTPGADEALDACTRACDEKDDQTRGLRQELLRRATKQLRPSQARMLFEEADRHYEAMVDRHGPVLESQVNRFSALHSDVDVKDIRQLVRLGWFRAALRWSPTADTTFPTYARSWGRMSFQQSNDRQRPVVFPRKLRKTGWERVRSASLDAPVNEDDPKSATAYDMLDLGELVGNSGPDLDRKRLIERMRQVWPQLDEQGQYVLDQRFLRGQTLDEIAETMDLSKERIRQIQIRALRILKRLLSPGTPEPVEAPPPAKAALPERPPCAWPEGCTESARNRGFCRVHEVLARKHTSPKTRALLRKPGSRRRKLYGWYSEQGAAAEGLLFYRTPEGQEIGVVAVSNSRAQSGTAWRDAILLGEVTDFCGMSPKRRAVLGAPRPVRSFEGDESAAS